MQFYRPGLSPAYGANESWWDALSNEGFGQMKHLKRLMLAFPFTERIPDQSIILDKNEPRYNRILATRGNDYLLVYNYTNRTAEIDLSKITGEKKEVWWYSPSTGELEYIGKYTNKPTKFQHPSGTKNGNDWVLIAYDANKNYIFANPNKFSTDQL